MERAESMSLEAPLFTSYNTPGQSENKVFGYERKWIENPLEKTINNYLKTPAEMDAEFSMEMNTARFMTWQYADHYKDKRTTVFTDGNSNAYSPDITPLGFMEENY